MKETSQKNRNIMSVLAVVIGLVLAYVVPFMAQTSLERVLVNLTAHIEDGFPAFTSGLTLFDIFFSAWRAVIFAAGAMLVAISPAIKKGEEWSYPTAMALFALPSIGGMFMFLPYVSWVPGFPLPMIISIFGLIGYWSFIFLRKGKAIQKWARFGALTFLGMLITHAFTIGIGAQRTMATRPGKPMYPDMTWWWFRWAGEVNWVLVIPMFLAIIFLSTGQRKGWWLAVGSAIAILMIDVPTQFVRTSTWDYLNGSLLAIGVLIFTLVPFFKNEILDEEEVEATA